MELRHLLNLGRRWLWLVLLGAALGAGAGYGISLLLPPVYQSTATILLNQTANPNGPDLSDLLAADRLGKTYVDLIQRRDVLQQAIQELHLSLTPEDLAKQTDAQQVRDTQLVEVSVRDGSAAQATDLANRISTVFIARLGETNRQALETRRTRLESELADNEKLYQDSNNQLFALNQLKKEDLTADQKAEITRLSGLVAEYGTTRTNLLRTLDALRQAEATVTNTLVLIEPATISTKPVFPIIPLDVVLGLVAGLGLAAALAWVLEQLDDRLKTADAVQEILGLPTLSVVPGLSGPRSANAVAALAPPQSPAAEAYRFLRTNLDFTTIDQPPRLVLVSSVTPGANAATVGANLAAAAAAGGRRVLLVDADLRAPQLHQLFNLPNTRGLTGLALDPDPTQAAPGAALAARDVPHLWVLPSGPLPPSPADLLGSARLATVLATLRGGYDLVVLVAAPVLAASDALALAPRTDGVVLVLDTPTTRRADALAAVAALRQVGSRVLGVVLDRAHVDASASPYAPVPVAPVAPVPSEAPARPGRAVVASKVDE